MVELSVQPEPKLYLIIDWFYYIKSIANSLSNMCSIFKGLMCCWLLWFANNKWFHVKLDKVAQSTDRISLR